MTIRGVRSPRVAQLALAALICVALSACKGELGAANSAAATSPTNNSVTLSWSPPTENSDGSSITNLAGYTLHYGTASEDYTGSIQITSPTTTSYVVSGGNFPPGTYYFAISAYNAQQVSSPLSGEISVTVD